MNQFFQAENGIYYPIKDVTSIWMSARGAKANIKGGFEASISLTTLSFLVGDHTFGNAIHRGEAIPAPPGWRCFSVEEGCGCLYDLIAFVEESTADLGSYLTFLSPWGLYKFAISPAGRVYSVHQVWDSLELWHAAQEKAPPVLTDEAH